MDWSNTIALAVGLGVGVLASRRPKTQETEPTPQASDNTAELSAELAQLQLNAGSIGDMMQFKGGFLARVSHEIRAPLSNIISTHQIILADLCNDAAEEREFLEQANTSALKMVGLLDEIFKVAKIERGKLPLKVERLSLETMFEEVYCLTYMQAADRNYPFNVEFPDADIEIEADFKMLRQILVNSIQSTIDGMDGGSINFSAGCFPDENQVRIWLDSPCPPDAWNDPVDLLQQETKPANPAEKSDKNAPGLSWLMSQTLLEKMGGRLEILAPPTDGDSAHLTRIQCSLPRATPDRSQM
ncbi:MAG: HAMP domain-containing sensor histidine kinase [Geitlerinemataceae cyanobacterium]